MKPKEKIATARTPGGFEMRLFRHDRDFSIMVDGYELMSSRQHESEMELARLGCASLSNNKAPCVLIGGLGLGYTLRQTLDMLNPQAKVVVAELMGAVVEWNRDHLGDLNGHPLRDKRVELRIEDVAEVLSRSENKFDAILLDIDNGPHAMSDSGNERLYSRDGILACRRALRGHGCLGVWSAEPSKDFERLLMGCGFHVRRYRAAAYKGSKSQSRFVWVASEDRAVLPPGGGEPLPPPQRKPERRPGRFPKRRQG